MTTTITPTPSERQILTGAVSGPNPYAAGGFVLDLSGQVASLAFAEIVVSTVGANLPPCHYEYALNSPAAGKVTIKIMRHRYDATGSETDVLSVEIGAVDLSGTTWRYLAVGP